MIKLLALTIPLSIFFSSVIIHRNSTNEFPVDTVNQIHASQATANPAPIIPTPTPTPIPLPYNHAPLPTITARAFEIYDLSSETILAQQAADRPLPPASTTKIMTALIAIENFKPDQIITVPPLQINGANIGLEPQEQITVKNLLYGMLLQSGNDTAYTLAYHYPQGLPGFVSAMNLKVKELGLENTHFINPHGLHDPLHLSSAHDLILISKYALKNQFFTEIVATKSITVTDITGKKIHHLTNINQLLDNIPGVKGVKTGWTEQAGEALITLVDRNNHQILIAVLSSQDRFTDTIALIDWAYKYTVWN